MFLDPPGEMNTAAISPTVFTPFEPGIPIG
jgi:hypothetical protein